MDELLAVIQGAQLIENKKDEWIWRLEGEGLYTVNSSYVFLQGQPLEETDNAFKLIWTAPLPSNNKAFAWRLLLGRIQTRDNLLKRHVINGFEESLCPQCVHLHTCCSHARCLLRYFMIVICGWVSVLHNYHLHEYICCSLHLQG